MAKTYLVWKDPACEGHNIEWLALSGPEFYQMLHKPESKSRYFIRLPGEIGNEDDTIFIEATHGQYIAWRKEQNRHNYLARHDRKASILSLDFQCGEGDEGSLHEVIADSRVDVEREIVALFAHERLALALDALTDDEVYLLSAVYQDGKSFADLGTELHVTRQAISQRVSRIVDKLKKYF